jgi:SAM-dependent methyltransferase
MSFQDAHPMMPTPRHDELARQLFVRDLKIGIAQTLDPPLSRLANALDPGGEDAQRVETVQQRMHEVEAYREWLSLRRTSQELLWDVVGEAVERQAPELEQRAREITPKGSLRLDPDFTQPAYLDDADTHMMPGGYPHDPEGESVLQGAIMDLGGAVFMLGRNGGLMNDVRGHTAASHLFARYRDMQPKRILEMGCGVGASAVAVATYFPDAEMHAIDVGASMLRYAHARAEHLGVKIHFSQQNAEHTDFADGSFDLVFSCVLLHETSPEALRNILAESHRLLAPGGVAIHLEVPMRAELQDLWGKLQSDFEMRYNNEPHWNGALAADYEAELRRAGFDDVAVGYQEATSSARRGNNGFSDEPQGVFRSWFVASGRKSAGA